MKKINELFNFERRKTAEKYNKNKKKYNLLLFFVTIIFLVMFFSFKIELKFYYFLERSLDNNELNIFLYIFLLYLILSILQTFIDYFTEYKLDYNFNLLNQNKRGWLADQIKSFLISFIFLYLAARLFLYLTDAFPERWWIYFAVIASLFLIIINFLFPIIFLPLFFKLESYPESKLKENLLKLVKKAGVKVDDIYEINLSSKINAANAAVMGIGKSRKIVLADNLKMKYSSNEIKAVLAHELGHQAHADILKNLLIQTFIFFIISFVIYLSWPLIVNIYGYQSIYSIYTLPLLLIYFYFLSWLISPAQLFLSRRNEKRADYYAVELTGEAKALACALAKIADEGLLPLKVSFYKRVFKISHPPVKERIEYIFKI